MKPKTLALAIVILLTQHAFLLLAQEVRYARSIVGALASPEMKGRGYVGKGERLAAQYIKEALNEIGLQPYGKNYFQYFETPVNTFPGKASLTLNNQVLVPGKDFLVDPGSPSIQGSFDAVMLLPSDILNDSTLAMRLIDAKGRFIVVDATMLDQLPSDYQQRINDVINFLKYHPNNPAAGTVILTNQKLVWGASTNQSLKPTFIVHAQPGTAAIFRIEAALDSKFIPKYRTQNVIGYVEGHRSDSLIVITAHYDHLGMLGRETVFPGANDNASGVAMLLSLAKHYAANKPEYTMVFIAFGGEELGLLGSSWFVEHPLFPLSSIKFLVNFDIAGTGDDGIQVVNGSVFRDKYNKLVELNNDLNLLPQVKIRGEACNSDHCLFYKSGVSCFFIYTLGGIQAYHDIYDKSETLPLTEFADYQQLMISFLESL